jgi:hypothetical protein
MSGVNVAIAAVILEKGWQWWMVSMILQGSRKKSIGVRSGERGGHKIVLGTGDPKYLARQDGSESLHHSAGRPHFCKDRHRQLARTVLSLHRLSIHFYFRCRSARRGKAVH